MAVRTRRVKKKLVKKKRLRKQSVRKRPTKQSKILKKQKRKPRRVVRSKQRTKKTAKTWNGAIVARDESTLDAKQRAQATPLRAPDATFGEAEHDAMHLYLKEIGISDLLTEAEEKKYGRLAKKGDPVGRRKMIEGNLRLVVRIARHYHHRGVEFADLIEEGNLGLLRAVDKFDPNRGFRFSTYATWWIRQSIERAIMNQTRTIRLPIHMLRTLNKQLIAARELMKVQDHEPTQAEIAGALHQSVDRVSSIMMLNEHIISLDSSASHDGLSGKSLVEVFPDQQAMTPEESVETEDLHRYLMQHLEHLDAVEREVICRRFGLESYDRHTLDEVSQAMNITRERVRHIQLSALKALRSAMLADSNAGHPAEKSDSLQ